MGKSLSESLELTKLAETRWGPKRHWRCVYCGRGAGMVVDHFEPSHMGGTNDVTNLFPACDRCNSSKNGLDPWGWMEAAGVPLARQVAILRVRKLPSSATVPPPPPDRFTLNYALVAAQKASVRLFRGK